VSQLQSQSVNLGRLADMATEVKGQRLGDIYLAVTTLFEHQDGSFSQRERTLATDILRRLSKDVEMTIRIALAERMADNPAAPHELLLLLADDHIEVARPILARSQLLSDSDLVHIIEVGSADHHIAVAERAAIGEPVSAALAKLDSEDVLVALLRNATAKIGHDTFSRLLRRAEASHALHEPLVERPDLPPALAQKMYSIVSDALKTALTQRYPHAADAISTALDETSAAFESGAPTSTEAGASKLIAKLASSGQLKSSFLVRVLQQGQMDLFEHGFAAMLGMDVEVVRRALFGERTVLLALACRAVGIDRAVFMTVFNLSRHNQRGSRLLSETDQKDIQDVYLTLSKGDALAKFKTSAFA
jgi:uncharacterized protein (DUF2336 family)